MKTARRISAMILCAALATMLGNLAAYAQNKTATSRVVGEVDDTRTMQMQGNVHPQARAEFDRGALAESQPMTRMMLLLQRSPEQETALRQLLDEQHVKGSANFHAWLTPEQFGKQFGPSDADVQAVTDWLTRQGFQVAKVSAGRTVVEFSGNVAQVQTAFHTEIHKFAVNGQEYFANVSDPAIPAALSPVVKGVVALHNFPKFAQSRKIGGFQRNLATGQVKPLFTYTDSNGTFYGVGPADFKEIYNIPKVADGSEQTIAIVGQSNINIQDVRDFRSMFGLAAKDPQIIVNGPDPGVGSADETEADLDVEWAGAVAPAAQIVFVTSQSTESNPTQVSAGIDLSALYIIDNNLAPVMSESYGVCEAALGTAGNAFYNTLWQQAAAQGITVAVSSGDNGPAGCDPAAPPANQNAATQGVAVSGIASTPYNVAVGGTDFDQAKNQGTYWNPTNATMQLSAKGYIPEVPWDDSPCAANFPTACTSVDSKGADVTAGSGGPSTCQMSTTSGSTTTCAAGYAKPSYQISITPLDSARDLPDISFFSSDGFNHSFYVVCQSDANPNNAPCDLSTSATSPTHNFSGVGGTSAATPPFAAIVALVNQQTGQRQGNVNYVLYALAAKDANYTSGKCNSAGPPAGGCVFNDVMKGNNSVACVGGTPNCSNTGSGFGVITYTKDNGNPAFQAVTGYDLATGLGSINVANLLANWGSVSRAVPITTLTGPSGGSPSGQNFTATVTVVPAPTGTAGTENVSLIALAADKSTVLGSIGPFALNFGGVTSVATNLLPPGTANVQATYGGDALLAASTSAVVALSGTVSGAGFNSKTTLNFVTFDTNGNPTLSTASQNVSYGSNYMLSIVVTNSNGTSCTGTTPATKPLTPCPTGTVTITDNGNPLNDWPSGATSNATNVAKLNNQGIAEDQPVQFAPGSHSVLAKYTPGDPNYQAGTSNTLSVTVTKATTSVSVSSTLSSITSGTSVTLTAYVITNSNGAGPTPTVQFANGTTNLGSAVTCVPTSGAQNTTSPISGIGAGTAYCKATLTTTISSVFPPGVGRPKAPTMPVIPVLAALLSLVLFAMGWKWMPEKRRRAYAYAGLVAFALLAVGIAGCGGGGGGGGTNGGKTVTINASYPGDTNYSGSTGSTTITVR
jgi:hypothetical protein